MSCNQFQTLREHPSPLGNWHDLLLVALETLCDHADQQFEFYSLSLRLSSDSRDSREAVEVVVSIYEAQCLSLLGDQFLQPSPLEGVALVGLFLY